MSDNPRTLVQTNVRIPQGVRDEYSRMATKDGTEAMRLIYDAIMLYRSIRASMTERVWYLLAGAARAEGLEYGELLARLSERAYAEWGDELFAPRRPHQGARAK